MQNCTLLSQKRKPSGVPAFLASACLRAQLRTSTLYSESAQLCSRTSIPAPERVNFAPHSRVERVEIALGCARLRPKTRNVVFIDQGAFLHHLQHFQPFSRCSSRRTRIVSQTGSAVGRVVERMACDLERSSSFGLGRVHGMWSDPLERMWPYALLFSAAQSQFRPKSARKPPYVAPRCARSHSTVICDIELSQGRDEFSGFVSKRRQDPARRAPVDAGVAVEMAEDLLHIRRKDMDVPSSAVLSHGADLHGPGEKSAFRLVAFDEDQPILLVFENDRVPYMEILGEILAPLRAAEPLC